MKSIVAYQLFLLLVIVTGACLILQGRLPSWLDVVRVPIICAMAGGLGGITYCLRGV